MHRGFGDGCGLFVDGYGLFRVDVLSGETIELISQGSWFAFSPDERSVAYLSGSAIFIRDLISGTVRKAILDITNEYEEVFLNDLIWSPDGLSIVVQAGINICLNTFNSQRAIVLIDAETLFQSLILEDPSIRRIYEWSEPNILLLLVQEESRPSRTAEFFISTGEIVPINE